MRRLVVLSLLAGALVPAADAAAAENPWLGLRVMNIAHQGGEDEAPSNTMYAYRRALGVGSDMLEVDIHSTVDNRIVVLHDGRVDRTTEGSGSVYEMTLEQVQALDAAYDFVPGVGTPSQPRPESEYVFRGVRTGARPPPPGYGPDDFRIPTLEEVLTTYPDIPVNIEIKGTGDSDVDSFLHNAELLAVELKRLARSEGIIVASFNDLALQRFHELAPEVGLAPATGAVAAWKLANAPLPEGVVAFQVPITFGGLSVTDAEFVQRAHAQGYAVHVWLSGQREAPDVYEQLLDWNVDGVMAAEPTSLERVLCLRNVVRPVIPRVRHCPTEVLKDCDVRPVGVSRVGRRGYFRVRLRRERPVGRCSGVVRVREVLQNPRAARLGRRLAAKAFVIRDGRSRTRVRLQLSRYGWRELGLRLGISARVVAEPLEGKRAARRVSLLPRRRALRLGPGPRSRR